MAARMLGSTFDAPGRTAHSLAGARVTIPMFANAPANALTGP
jgi:hypothetical protein